MIVVASSGLRDGECTETLLIFREVSKFAVAYRDA